MVRTEGKQIEELISAEAKSRQVLVVHFGNGDEHDEASVYDYVSQFGKVEDIAIYPGINYGHISFETEA
jgi:hypothetical protein